MGGHAGRRRGAGVGGGVGADIRFRAWADLLEKPVGDAAGVVHVGLMTLRSALIAAILAILPATTALAQDAELIHSDAPLWAPGSNKVWPQHFVDGESFGCTHRIQLGIWRYKATDGDLDDERYRFGNYGVFHCWMNVSHGYGEENFEESRPSFLVQLGQAGAKELWVLQMGARPGSDYLLLARVAGVDRIERFEVLQRRCPKGRARGGPSLDILLTRYCDISSKDEMLMLARRMAKLPALGVIAFERGEPDGE